MQEISCTRGPENKPGAAIPAYPWQGHGNNTHTHTHTCSSTNSHISLWTQSAAGPDSEPTPPPAGTRQRHLQDSDANSSTQPALPLEVLLPNSPEPAPGLEVLLPASLPACLQRRLLPAALVRNAIAASSFQQPRSGDRHHPEEARSCSPAAQLGGMPQLMKVNGTSSWQLQPALSQSQQRGAPDSPQAREHLALKCGRPSSSESLLGSFLKTNSEMQSQTALRFEMAP